MKASPYPSLTLILFAIVCANSILLLCSAATPEPVLDVDGNKVRAGVNYYILPVIRGRGGGLTLTSRRNASCPQVVVQEQQEVKNGFPVWFTPVNPKKGVVRESTDMNIVFSAPSSCRQSTTWRLDSYDESTKQYFITTNGVQGNPGIGTISNWFKIVAYENDYKLVFCPTVCNYCKVICRDVGIFLQDGMRRLALRLSDDVPFRVMFKKA